MMNNEVIQLLREIYIKLVEDDDNYEYSESSDLLDKIDKVLFEIDNKGWIEWKYTKETPHPYNLETLIDVKFEGGIIRYNNAVKFWYDPIESCSNFYQDGCDSNITFYRISEGCE